MKPLLLMVFMTFASENSNFAQTVSTISRQGLEDILNNPSDKLHVINFWASWCGPCVTELPEFQKAMDDSDSTRVDFVFISLDFPPDAEKKLYRFLKRNNYNFNVAWMTDTDYNTWIDMVDPRWQGNIPVTLFINNSKHIHYFVPQAMDNTIIQKTINSLLIN